MAIDTSLILADQGIVRLAFAGRVRYGLWKRSGKGGRIRLYEGSPFSGGRPGRSYAPLAQARLLAPCRPSKVVAVGLNYKAHAREMKKPLPQEPLIFLKPASAVIGPGQPVVRPAGSRRVDFEAELAVVIGRRCRRVSPEQAPAYILGYTCLNDVTERHLQKKDVQYTRAKGFDTFCPLGPVIAQDLDPHRLRVRSFINQEPRQDSNTADLIFPIPLLVSFISQVMTQHPGDVIATGTPAGVGPMRYGDQVTIEVEGIGRLVNPVKDQD